MPLVAHSWNADRELLRGGRARTRIGVKWRNFLGDQGWEKIDLSLREAGGTFTLSKAPYGLSVPKLANDWAVIESTNRYDIWTKRVMPDAAAGIQKRYICAAVSGVLTADGVLFPMAFPALGADRLVKLHEQKVRDLIVFRSEPPGNGPVEVPLEIDFGSLPILESAGQHKQPKESDFRTDKDINFGLTFTIGRFRGIQILPPMVWDSKRKSEPIKLRGKVIGSQWVGKKVIPRKFFKDAVYPVYADTTTTFYPDPEAGSTSFDGTSGKYLGDGSWGSLHDASDGNTGWFTSSGGDQNVCEIDAYPGNGWYSIYRGFTLFDTSTLAGATISSAKIGLTLSLKVDDFGNGGFDIVGCSTLSNTELSNSDYGGVGITPFITRASFGSLGLAPTEFDLNGDGLAAIIQDGVSKFAMRLANDTDDTPPDWDEEGAASQYLGWYSAEVSGTGDDPYLEVVYTIPPATSYTFDGPTSGIINVASTNFTVEPNGPATETITPATDGSGSFTPSTVTFDGTAAAKTFTYTPTSTVGSPHTLSVTNDGSLADPASIDYTVNAAGGGGPALFHNHYVNQGIV